MRGVDRGVIDVQEPGASQLGREDYVKAGSTRRPRSSLEAGARPPNIAADPFLQVGHRFSRVELRRRMRDYLRGLLAGRAARTPGNWPILLGTRDDV